MYFSRPCARFRGCDKGMCENHKNRLVRVEFSPTGKPTFVYACEVCAKPLKSVVTEVEDFVA